MQVSGHNPRANQARGLNFFQFRQHGLHNRLGYRKFMHGGYYTNTGKARNPNAKEY